MEPMGERGRQGAAPLGGHTPGPWSTWGPDHKAGEEAWHINGLGHQTVAFTYSRPDALLIAAAPELLGALENLIATPYLEGWDKAPAVKRALVAIAKARGEQ